MAERFYGKIEIGGPIPQHLLPELAKKLIEEGLMSVGDKLKHFLENNVLFFADQEARYGCFEYLELFLEKHNIEYDRWSETSYDFECEDVKFRKKRKPCVKVVGKAGQHLIFRDDMTKLLKLKDADKIKKRIRKLIGPKLPPLQPIKSKDLAMPCGPLFGEKK